jgi:hypothetical protein
MADLTVSGEFEKDWQEALAMSEEEQVRMVFSRGRDIFAGSGYSGGTPLDQIKNWVEEEFLPRCQDAGEQGKKVFEALADIHIAHNVAMGAVVADFLIKQTSFVQWAHSKELAALILLIAAIVHKLNSGK